MCGWERVLYIDRGMRGADPNNDQADPWMRTWSKSSGCLVVLILLTKSSFGRFRVAFRGEGGVASFFRWASLDVPVQVESTVLHTPVPGVCSAEEEGDGKLDRGALISHHPVD